jgi:hypothetical protein
MKNARTKSLRVRALTREPSPKDGDAPTPAKRMLTRVQVAKALGCSHSLVRKMEKAGKLPVYEVDGVHVFATRDVELLRVHRVRAKGLQGVHVEGELAAEVFALLASGVGVVEIVGRMRVHPDVVESVAAQHARMTAAVLLDASTLDQLRALLPANEVAELRARTPAELLAQMQRAVAAAHLCRVCSDATARFCGSCAPTKPAELPPAAASRAPASPRSQQQRSRQAAAAGQR